MTCLNFATLRPFGPVSLKSFIAALLLLLTALSASAQVSFRFSSTSNLIYVEDNGSGGSSASILDLFNASEAASTDWGFRLNAADGAWETRTPIIVENGVRFTIAPEIVDGNTINTLRLKGDSTMYTCLYADRGHLLIDNMTITSWDFDPLSPGPDTDPADGRPYISAISSDAGDSDLTITNSTLTHLGWNNGEQCAVNWVVKRSQSGSFLDSEVRDSVFRDCVFNARDLDRDDVAFENNTFDGCAMGDFDLANLGSNSANNPAFVELRPRVDRVVSAMRLYLLGPGPATLSYIRFFLERNFADDPDALLVNEGSNTWLLRAELRLSDGARLNLHGSAIGGDCDELRLRSNGDESIDDFTVIRADYGHIDMRNTLVTSWDENEADYDFTPSRSSFDAETLQTVSGDPEYRAHIWVVSRKPLNGQKRESRMDVIDSTVQYLGYQAGKAYGLSWKVEDFAGEEPVVDSMENETGVPHAGCGASPKVKEASVWGDIKGSTLQFLHFGVYTFGHGSNTVQTEWTDNELAFCNVYGFDPHDDSDNLLIANNEVHDNGKHGIIASKFCDGVVVRNNDVYANGENGIMIHDGSNDALVEDNRSRDNGDSGIAIFDACRTTVRNNEIANNVRSGIRLSMGTSFGLFEGNTIDGSGQYGIYAFQGSDVAQYSDPDRINTGNIFRSNTIRNTVEEGLKIQGSLDTVFESNTFSGIATSGTLPMFRFESSQNTTMRGNSLPASSVFKLRDEHVDGNGPVSVIVSEQQSVAVEFTDASSFNWVSGLLTEAPQLSVTMASPVDAGHVIASPQVWAPVGLLSKRLIARADAGGRVLDFGVGNLIPGAVYEVRKDGSVLTSSAIASSAGVLTFSDTSSNAAAAIYEIFSDQVGAGAPTLTNPGDQTNDQGESVSLTLSAHDPNGDSLKFTAANLPGGLAIDQDSGIISGDLTSAGVFTVSATVDDQLGGTDSVSFTWTVRAVGPAENDALRNFVAPALVQRGEAVTVSIDYESTQNHELWIWLQDSNSRWRTVASGNLTLTPGTGTHTFNLTIAADARVGDGYVWVARLLPQGWASADDALSAEYTLATVQAGPGGGEPTIDQLGGIDLPGDVLSPDTVSLEVPYEAIDRRELAVWLHDSQNGYFTIGHAITTVERGIGTHLFSVPILSNAREGNGYVWAVRLLPLGWSSAGDALDAKYGAASVARNTGGGVTQDVLVDVAVPTTVQPTETVVVSVAYEATVRRDLGIWLHDANDGYRTVGHALAKVDPGVGNQLFNIGIVGDARVGDGFVWAVRLLPEGWASANDALDAFYQDATVEENAHKFVNFAALPQASATQSSVYGAAFKAELARDGNTDGDWRNGSVTHTELNTNAWWEVDLGGVKDIDHILLWNRTDCCGDRLVPYYVFVSDTPFASTDLDATRAQAGVKEYYFATEPVPTQRVDLDGTGRYVRIQLAGSNYLSLSEVEVYGVAHGLVNGVTYAYYEGAWSQLPEFDSLSPVQTGTLTNINLDSRARDDFFAFRFRGCLDVPTDGSYTFYMSSRNGSKLLVDNQVVVDNDGAESLSEASGTVQLTAGMHPIEIQYFERDSATELTISWEGPGISRQEIPGASLALNETGLTPGFHFAGRRVAPDDNADGDLLDLTAEYALGRNPGIAAMHDMGLNITASADGEGLDVWYDRPARLGEIAYDLEASSDLDNWAVVGGAEVEMDSYGWERVTYRNVSEHAMFDQGRGFVRLRIQHYDWNYETTTPVIGWVDTELRAGYQTHGLSLTQPPVFAGVISEWTGTHLVASSGGLLDNIRDSRTYYLELTSGPLAGHRIDIDPTGSADQSIALAWDAPHNTLATPPTDAAWIDSDFVVRPHWTLATAYPIASFIGSTDPAQADQLHFFNANGYDSYFLLKADGFEHWVAQGDNSLAPADNRIIPPGNGCFIQRPEQASGIALTAIGQVRASAFVQPLVEGYNLLASPYPVDMSPADRLLQKANGFLGSIDPVAADQIQVWLGDATENVVGYQSFFLLDNGPEWQFWTDAESTELRNADGDLLFPADRAFFFKAIDEGHPAYQLP